jgi:hypothetical protein
VPSGVPTKPGQVQLHNHQWSRFIRLGLLGVVWVTFLGAAGHSIKVAMPSFVFVVPGIWLNGDTWDFIINHRGTRTSYSVEILFVDKDRREYLTRTQKSLTPDDLNSYQMLLRLPEVNPKGRGSVFAKQFMWKPFSPLRSHFEAEITWRDGSVHEEVEIAKIQDKWTYAISLTDRESGKSLLRCHDKEFPSTETLPPCFPAVTLPE